MAWVISVVGLKGGTGKSTLTITLATALHGAGNRVLIVDADPQGTARAWATRAAELEREGPAVVALTGTQLRRDLAGLARTVDVVIIDTPPRLGADARAAMLVADLVLLPTTPGAADLWALQETLTVLAEARALRDVKAAVVFNRLTRTTLARMCRKAVDDYGVSVLDATLGARVAFGEAVLAGLGIMDYSVKSEAAHEARRLSREVLETLGANERGAKVLETLGAC